MSLITLGLYGLAICALGVIAALASLIITRRETAWDRLAEETSRAWQEYCHEQASFSAGLRGPAGIGAPVPPYLEPYVNYERAHELHTSPVDYARAMHQAGHDPEDVSTGALAKVV